MTARTRLGWFLIGVLVGEACLFALFLICGPVT